MKRENHHHFRHATFHVKITHLKTATPLRNQGTHKLSAKNSQSYTRGHPIKPAKITTSAQEQPNNYFPIIRRIDL